MTRNDWIWNNGGVYDTSSESSSSPFNFLNHGILGGVDNFLGWALFGDQNSSSELFGELTGYNSQQREFQQQEYLMDKQNEYNNPVNQMARMKAAGINPNTAAAGISQGGNESAQAPQVSSNTQGAAAGLSAAASMLGGIGQAAQVASMVRKNNAEADNNEAAAHRSNVMLPFDCALSLENIGLARENAQAIAIENFYRPQSLMLDISQKRLTLPILRKQYDVLDSEYKVNMQSINNMIQEIKESEKRIDLMTYTQRMQSALAEKSQAEANLISRKFQLLRDMNWDVSTGLGGLLAGYAVYDGVGSLELNLNKLQNALFKINYSESKGTSMGGLNAQEAVLNYEYGLKRGLIAEQEEADKRVNKEQRKGEFWNKTADKWIRVPSSISGKFGPFQGSMSTE